MAEPISHIKKLLSLATKEEYEKLKCAYKDDKRKGIHTAFDSCKRRLLKEEEEKARIYSLYDFDQSFASSSSAIILGLDEVGRGPVAGPLAIGGVVLDYATYVGGLNDSKKIPESKRDSIADTIMRSARAYHISYVDPAYIDQYGITSALKKGFIATIHTIEKTIAVDYILLDGIPLHLDPREHAVIKGDSKSAAIAAASIVAKTSRDALMRTYADQYPHYAFEKNKGYGSEAHIQAIKKYGLSPLHRKSFCTSFLA